MNFSWADVEWRFGIGSSPYVDTLGSTAEVDYGLHPSNTNDPIETAYGGLYESQNMACQYLQENLYTTQASTYFYQEMHIYIYFYMFDTFGTQTIVEKYGDSTGGKLTYHFRLYTVNSVLYIDLTDASSATDTAYTTYSAAYNGITIQTGWNFIAVDVYPVSVGFFFNPGIEMYSQLYYMNDKSCDSGQSIQYQRITNIMSTNWLDDPSYYFCFGNQQTQVGTGNPTTYVVGNTPISGYIKNFVAGEYRINSTSDFSSYYQCGGCTGNCSMCDQTGVCAYGQSDPEILAYDFTQGSLSGGSTWVGTQSAAKGSGPSFTIAKDWFAKTPYYVDNQGLYYNGTQFICSANGFTFGSTTHEFSAGVWFKYTGAGSLITLLKSDGTVAFDLQAYNTGFTVTVGTSTATLSCSYPGGNWVYLTVTVTVRTATTSNVCVLAAGCNSCGSTTTLYTDPGNLQICTGKNSYKGMIKSIHFYSYPLSLDEMSYTFKSGGCTTFNGGSCLYCSVVTGACYSNCNNNQYGASCSTCNANCSSCFNSLDSQCYSCDNDVYNVVPKQQYIYASTLCPSCGDSYIYGGAPYLEQCDDGNQISGDGCSSTCQVETDWTCTPSFITGAGPSKCSYSCIDGTNPTLYTINGTNTTTTVKMKDCDDGNGNTDDGCTPLCNVNTGWKCANGTATTPDKCVEICGDGYDYHTYPCDDGNLNSGDGCSSTCQIEDPGYTCQYGDYPWPDICTMACQVRATDFGDMPCIDDNATPLDGCNQFCEVEQGWECTKGSPFGIDSCTEVCGDSYNFGQYQCDDGNVNYPFSLYYDGCSWNTCLIDGGYDCRYSDWFSRDACNEICGDGYNFGVQGQWNYLNNNECDDGNQRPEDGCGDTCRIESGWSCSGGTTGREDVCTPLCGDWMHMYHEHCDDGNLMSGDGCSSSCIEEAGYRCTGGSHHWRDECVEICGDGRNIGYFVCDDGNTVSGDGCSSNCTLEANYECTGGSATTADVCTEVCGDGKNLGTVQCDDGNLLNGDGCSSTCKIEKGYKCVHPVNGKDVCTELCGDGIMLGSYSCDDGNLLNNDGCSSTCSIENCWVCDGLSPTHCTIPPQYTIGIQNATMADDQSNVTIFFNNSVILQSGFDLYSALQVSIVGPLAPYNFSWYLNDVNFIYQGVKTSQFSIMLNYLDTQLLGDYQENLTVCLTNVSQIKHWYCNKYMSGTPCWTFPLYYGKLAPKSYCATSGIATYGLYAVGGQLALGLFFSLLGYSAGGAWDALYLLQFAHLLPTMTISAPSCAVYFYQEFKWANMQEDSIANWMRNAICNVGNATDMKPPTYNFYQNGYQSTNLAYNLADTLTITMLALALIPAISVIKLLLPNAVIVDNMDRFIKGRYLIAIVNVTYIKIALLTLLNFNYFETDTVTKAFNSYVSVFFLLYIGIVPLYYLAQTVFFHRELNSLKKALEFEEVFQGEQNASNKQVIENKMKIIRNNFRNKVLLEEYRIESIWQYGFMMQFCLQRLIFAVVLAKLHYNVDYQIFMITTMSTLTLTYIAVVQPYKYPFRNGIAILNVAGQFYIYSASMVWARSDVFCGMNYRSFVAPMTYAFTGFLGFQALVWLICQFAFLFSKNGGKAPVAIEPEVVPKEVMIKQQYKDLHTQVEEERKRQKQERMDELKNKDQEGQEGKTKPQDEQQAKVNKADNDNVATGPIAGLPQPDETLNDRSENDINNKNNKVNDESEEEKTETLISRTQNDTTNRNTSKDEDEELSEIRASSRAEESQSRNQTYDDQDESRNQDNTQRTDSEYESSFRQNKARR